MRSPSVALVTLVAFVQLLLPLGRARADEAADLQAAKQRFESGRTAYLAGDYAKAISEFQAAQAIRPSPLLDYNIGLSYEGLGDGQNAFAAYQRYLAAKPDAENRAEVEQRMAALSQQAAQQQQQQPPPGQYDQQQQQQQAQQPPPPTGPEAYGQAGEYQPPAAPPPPAQPVKKKRYWWIVFPIVGGVALTALVVWAAVNAGSGGGAYACTPPSCNGTYDHALQALPTDPRTTPGMPAASFSF